jgi:hypothetical protein
MSSYMYFVQQRREEVRKNNPNLDNKHVISRLGQLWRALDEAGRAPYNALAKKDRERYLREKVEWEKKNPNFTLGKSGGRPAKNVGKSGGPKRAMSAYMFFVKEQRGSVKGANPGMDNRAIIRLLGQMWRDMSETGKAQYRAAAVQDKTRFENEKKTWVYTHIPNRKQKKRVRRSQKEIADGLSLAEVKKIRASTKPVKVTKKKRKKAAAPPKAAKKAKKKRNPNAPKRNMSSYMYFVKMRRDDLRKANPSISNKDVISLLGALWRGMDDNARKEFKDLAAMDKIRYDKERAAFQAKPAIATPVRR